MFYVYVLQSMKDGALYIGFSSDLKRRIAQHNRGESFATAPRRPFRLAYYEAYHAEHDARHREDSLKLRGRARRQLLLRIKKSLDIE